MDNQVYNQVKEDEPISLAPPEVATGKTIISPSGVPFKGNAASVPSRTSYTGVRELSVAPGESIQNAIEALNRDGGGKLFLQRGTHLVSSNITMYSKIMLVGETLDTTISFSGGDYQLLLHGTNPYTTGTIAVNNGSQVIMGTGTNFVVAGITINQRILIRGIWYNMQSVDSATQITLTIPYSGRSVTGEIYAIADYIILVGIENLLFQNTSINVSTVSLQYCSNIYFKNIELQRTSAALRGFEIFDSSFVTLKNIKMKDITTSLDMRRTGNVIVENMSVMDDASTSRAILLNGNKDSFSSFNNVVILNGAGVGFDITESSNIRIKGATILEGSGKGIQLQGLCSNISISESTVENCSGVGVELTATDDNCFITNCSLMGNGDYGINIAASTCDNNILSGNYFRDNTNGSIQDLGTGTIIKSSSNQQYFGLEQQFFVMTNNSGVQRVAGEVVIMNPDGMVMNGFTTTTIAGDNKVFGVVAETIAAGFSAGRIQTLGKLITLKVNGTTAIAIGDYLSTFTTAGIAMKAAAGDMCFAIALEAYTTNDSNGVIDALLISPRLI